MILTSTALGCVRSFPSSSGAGRMRRTPLAMIFCSALLLATPAISHDAEGTTSARLPDTPLPAPLDRV
ncbi:hypothetical protein, partial [Enterobacter hormaechei]|uniref:hypothetical protein n=1 Tax=Enterobacter hormaechei TaxID=158836 RepID=UPI001953E658